ncbi:MAG: redoxin family protein [Propionibacteriales bacterium]|nr:redoxin family protein [Propionibacteriales bacterium]
MTQNVRRLSAVSAATGATRKSLRGYEERGLVVPARNANGYREYSDHQVRLVSEIRTLAELGVPLAGMRPFVDCLNAGSDHADSCPAALSEYRRAIEHLDRPVDALTAKREALVANLATASQRAMRSLATRDALNPHTSLPPNLPAPVDDGAADGLVGRRLPHLALPSTDGPPVPLASLGRGRVLIYVFPMTGSPDHDMPEGWDAIPGARGCTPQSCDMRDHYGDLVRAGVRQVFGLSSQPVAYQSALVEALRLPYPLLTDEDLELHRDPGLPTFVAASMTLYRRQTLLLSDGVIEKVFHPIFPPDQHAQVVLEWLGDNPERAVDRP